MFVKTRDPSPLKTFKMASKKSVQWWKVFLVSLIIFVPGYCSRSPAPRHSWAITLDVDALSPSEMEEVFGELEREYRVTHQGKIGILHDTFHFELSNENSKILIEKRGLQDHDEVLNLVGSSLDNHHAVRWHSYQLPLKRAKRTQSFSDPVYGSQWHLDNQHIVGHDIGVVSVWEQGITGHSVNVCVIDDGVDRSNKDIAANFNEAASYDYIDNDGDPTPDHLHGDNHGTKCAGVIASVANNAFCGVGVAFNAKVSGIRILDNAVTDAREAKAFSHMLATNHIFSNSWGPSDNGRTVDGPGKLAQRVLAKAAVEGRCGLGSIYVVASGNGGTWSDNCNFDGYANSIYTVTIGSVSEHHTVPFYAEKCTATFGVTYSSSRTDSQRNIATTDVAWSNGGCASGSSGLTGTSASAPMAAGMIALMLDARWCLSMRDVQHILVFTAVHFVNDLPWLTNGAGFQYSDNFGFGLLNASRMVYAAKVWSLVPPQQNWTTPYYSVQEPITGKLKLNENVLQSDIGEEFKTLEHVTVTVTIEHSNRGSLAISLTSPSNTTAALATERNLDGSTKGFEDWTFSTVLFWGESPTGRWTLVVVDSGYKGSYPRGTLLSWKLSLYGCNLSVHDVEERKRLVEEGSSAPVQTCPKRVWCNDTTYELPPTQGSSPSSDDTTKYLIVLVLLAVVAILVYFIALDIYRRYKKRLSLPTVQFSRLLTGNSRVREESAHLLGEEKGEGIEDQEAQVDGGVNVSGNGVLAESLESQNEQTSDYLQHPQESIAVIAVKSHSPFLLSRMTEDDEEEEEAVYAKETVVDYAPCKEPLTGDVVLHQEHNTSTPSLVTVDRESCQPVIVVEKVNEEAVAELETIQQTQPELQERLVDDLVSFGNVPIHWEGAGPEVELSAGEGRCSDLDSKDVLSGD